MITKQSKDSMQYIESLVGQKLTLGSFLMSIRQGDGEIQAAFAKTLGISRQNLCDIEHGRRFVSPKMAAEYAEKLGYSKKQFVRLCLQDLLDREGLTLIVDVENAA
ncbi:XRE family transcriptional regulator [Legionella taurinensis]|uniref:XRE family transcriptional regulator n=2 Tax=Legionella taurinensis TaxID=70611 RepID=A0A3A5LGE7_9GAMM|nr:helix-turn-helix transcriptional regulator [Legionella taurinensis]MDX1838324.1 helix-turn-helix transcriptional regulator [Legionella taurinensis]PUT39089.1 XRE family transcriptional regulator [Legionella taurinensis]PUT39543.1 XRE family transcriptional regulator [Legionella taurinensis]PUT43545.1 XRE family transcriptional regulator [Legionella taurinensis]PUT45199.1 XRE family transcriptional regulator [Legionella taurinensis]